MVSLWRRLLDYLDTWHDPERCTTWGCACRCEICRRDHWHSPLRA